MPLPLLYSHCSLSMGSSINQQYSVFIFISILNHLETWIQILYIFQQQVEYVITIIIV